MITLTTDLISRASAEGIKVSHIVSVLKRIHNSTEHGVWEEVVTDKDVQDIWGRPEYRGGYIYSGWRVVENTVLPGADLLETRWSKSPTSEPTTPKGEWDAAVEAAPIGAILKMDCSLEYVDEWHAIKAGDNKWKVRRKCGQFAYREVELGVTLYNGIREDVAKELGIDQSSTFHSCFDAAVEFLKEE